MDEAIKLNVHDCGFVTLAPNNQYCKDHQIDFQNLVNINRNIISILVFKIT